MGNSFFHLALLSASAFHQHWFILTRSYYFLLNVHIILTFWFHTKITQVFFKRFFQKMRLRRPLNDLTKPMNDKVACTPGCVRKWVNLNGGSDFSQENEQLRIYILSCTERLVVKLPLIRDRKCVFFERKWVNLIGNP